MLNVTKDIFIVIHTYAIVYTIIVYSHSNKKKNNTILFA